MNFYADKEDCLFLRYPKVVIPEMKNYILHLQNAGSPIHAESSNNIFIRIMKCKNDDDELLFYNRIPSFVISYLIESNQFRISDPNLLPVYLHYVPLGRLKMDMFKGYKYS